MCRSAAGCSLLSFALGSPLRPFPCGALPAAAFPEPRRQRATSASGGGWPPITGRPAGAPDGPRAAVHRLPRSRRGDASLQCAVHRGQFPTGLGDRPRTRGQFPTGMGDRPRARKAANPTTTLATQGRKQCMKASCPFDSPAKTTTNATATATTTNTQHATHCTTTTQLTMKATVTLETPQRQQPGDKCGAAALASTQAESRLKVQPPISHSRGDRRLAAANFLPEGTPAQRMQATEQAAVVCGQSK